MTDFLGDGFPSFHTLHQAQKEKTIARYPDWDVTDVFFFSFIVVAQTTTLLILLALQTLKRRVPARRGLCCSFLGLMVKQINAFRNLMVRRVSLQER